MSGDERAMRAALCRVLEPGEKAHLDVVCKLGARSTFEELMAGRAPSGISEVVARKLRHVNGAAELEAAASLGIRLVIPGDDEWPSQLDDLEHVEPLFGRGGLPIGLWAKGPMRLDDIDPAVAIVGSRASTSYGEETARDLAADAGRAGMTVVSGAAYGIDAFAHRGALAAGTPTVAVLACGLDRAYPDRNRDLIAHLATTHVVISESPHGNAPQRIRFLARNRIIAALSRGTVVVEAEARSGALNSATWTSELSRPVMAVPGPVTSATSVGTHDLVRDKGASLITRGADMCNLLGRSGEHLQAVVRIAPRERDLLDPREQRMLESVPVTRPAATESISDNAGVHPAEAKRLLLRLSDRGFVVGTPTGWVQTPRAQT